MQKAAAKDKYPSAFLEFEGEHSEREQERVPTICMRSR